MATTNTIKMKIQFRRDTSANWELHKNEIPASGEPCFEIDTGVFKIGDGETSYGELKAINGVSLSADGKSIVLENGVFKLVGFDETKVGAQPRIGEDGNLEWVVPSAELETVVNTLKTDVETLKTDIADLKAIVGSADEGSSTLLSRIEDLEKEMDAFITGVGDNDEKINTLVELVDYIDKHGKEAANMASDITSLYDLVGSDPVKDQIAAAVADKVTVEEGKSLVADNLITKLEAIEEGAQANKIETIKVGDTILEIVDKAVTIPVGLGLKGSDEIEVAEDGTLSIKSISFDKIMQAEDVVIVMDGGSAV